jgi:hypothetical protein
MKERERQGLDANIILKISEVRTGNTPCLHCNDQPVSANQGEITIYCESHETHKYTLWASDRFFNMKAGGTYSNHSVL